MAQKVRVAATQFEIGTDLENNLEKTVGFIRKAAQEGADLVVTPEFVNHASWYDSPSHCFDVAVDLDGRFLQVIKDVVKDLGIHLAVNVTLRGDGEIRGSNLLIDQSGIIGRADKQVLIGHENDFLKRARVPSPVIETPLGRIGLYSCMDGVLPETPRFLALQGAQILCNSLNSFAFCEADLHIPVRAAENKVFVVAANKVGPLIPRDQLEPVSQAISIPAHFLSGAGESQIVAPDGSILAKASLTKETIICCDIDPSQSDDKTRPDGTHILASRKPEAYKPIASPQKKQDELSYSSDQDAPLKVAIIQPPFADARAIDSVKGSIKESIDKGSQLMVLPELFFAQKGHQEDESKAVSLSIAAKNAIKDVLKDSPECYVATTIISKGTDDSLSHQGIIMDHTGVIHSQDQIHAGLESGLTYQQGKGIQTLRTPHGEWAMVVGQDSIYPETFRLAALAGAQLVVCPYEIQESWERHLGLRERAAENRLAVVACSRKSPIPGSLIADLSADYTILTPWKDRTFDGRISWPLTQEIPSGPGTYFGEVHPQRAHNKILSSNTDVIASRAWHLSHQLTSSPTEQHHE